MALDGYNALQEGPVSGDMSRSERATAQPTAKPAAGSMQGGAVAIAVLIPCYNEELTIGSVVRDFRAQLPHARIYVYDNNSRDETAKRAAEAGAIVRREEMQGKGHVVRRMFRDIDADLYVLVDGDDTYDASDAPRMIETALSGPYDLVNAVRVSAQRGRTYRAGHRMGNRMLTRVVRSLFGNRVLDMLSGYKVLSRRFVKSFPALSGGFEIETELTVHALELSMPISHLESVYRARPKGSASKLRTVRDGRRILLVIFDLFKQERPLFFFSLVALLLACLAIGLAIPVFIDFINTGLVPRFPTAILATAIMLLAFLSFACGLILDTVTRGRREAKMLRYLGIAPVTFEGGYALPDTLVREDAAGRMRAAPGALSETF